MELHAPGALPPLDVEVGCLDCNALGNDVGITLGDVPVEVVDCISDGDVALICHDVDKGFVDYVRIVDVDRLSDLQWDSILM